jgi:hypothetical protein
MDNLLNDPLRENDPAMTDRRNVLVAGLGLAAASLFSRIAVGAPAQQTGEAPGAQGTAATTARGKLRGQSAAGSARWKCRPWALAA